MAVKKLGKKGVFLTFIAIAIVAAAIVIFTPSGINLAEDTAVVRTRVSNVNNYVLDLENIYLERTLQSTGTKTILSLILYMNEQNDFLTDLDANFKEVLLNGTINGVPIDDITGQQIMTNSTYNNWTDRIKNIAKSAFNVNTSFVVNDIKVYQLRPWFVNVDANVSFTVSSESASWDKDALIKTEIDIENFNDPYYLVNTGGSYENKINKSNVKFDEWHVENVSGHIKHGTYVHWENSNAPSFLMRFANDISPSSCCGIESLVNPNNPAIINKDVSYVDYLYWSSAADCNNPALNLYSARDISSQFPGLKLDFNHLALYNLTADAQICPPPG